MFSFWWNCLFQWKTVFPGILSPAIVRLCMCPGFCPCSILSILISFNFNQMLSVFLSCLSLFNSSDICGFYLSLFFVFTVFSLFHISEAWFGLWFSSNIKDRRRLERNRTRENKCIRPATECHSYFTYCLAIRAINLLFSLPIQLMQN